jgi:hypothetical protein
MDDGATANTQTESSPMDDGVWHKADFVRVSSTERYMYIDGVQIASTTTNAGSLTGAAQFDIGQENGTSIASSGSATYSLVKLSASAPSYAQIRAAYEAERGMFVASAECLLQSGSTDAVLDVDVDPLTGKVLVTQTDAITIFDGLVVDSKPTVNAGASEKGKLWGDLRSEQNDTNVYVTAPAVDQRQVNEMVRGMASDLPAGVDVSKAKAWIFFDGSTIEASYNIKSVSGTALATVTFGIPFKTSSYVILGMTQDDYILMFDNGSSTRFSANIRCRRYTTQTLTAQPFRVAFFGELENE